MSFDLLQRDWITQDAKLIFGLGYCTWDPDFEQICVASAVILAEPGTGPLKFSFFSARFDPPPPEIDAQIQQECQAMFP